MNKQLGEGDSAFIRIEGFNPPWRQAVVVRKKKRKKKEAKLVFAARVGDSELTEEHIKELTLVECAGGYKFVLVEGEASRAREICGGPHRALELDPAEIRSRAINKLDEEDLLFATASEDPDMGQGLVGRTNKDILEQSDSGEESESSASDDGLLNMLAKADGVMTAEDMPTGKAKSLGGNRKSRYPMLEGKKEKSLRNQSHLLETVLKQTVASGSKEPAGGQLNALVQLEILKTLQQKGKRSKGRSSPSNSSDNELTSSSSSSSDDDKQLRGAGKALQAYRKGKRSMRKHPTKHVRRYIKEVETFLGVTKDLPYQLTDYSKRLNWGKNKSLLRVHFAVSSSLQLLLQGKSKLAALQLTQLLRALHQASLDNGSWATAWLLLHLPDPISQPKFGGEPQDLEVIASYIKAMGELEKRGRYQPKTDSDAASDPKDPKGKGKKGKKQGAEENLDQ